MTTPPIHQTQHEQSATSITKKRKQIIVNSSPTSSCGTKTSTLSSSYFLKSSYRRRIRSRHLHLLHLYVLVLLLLSNATIFASGAAFSTSPNRLLKGVTDIRKLDGDAKADAIAEESSTEDILDEIDKVRAIKKENNTMEVGDEPEEKETETDHELSSTKKDHSSTIAAREEEPLDSSDAFRNSKVYADSTQEIEYDEGYEIDYSYYDEELEEEIEPYLSIAQQQKEEETSSFGSTELELPTEGKVNIVDHDTEDEISEGLHGDVHNDTKSLKQEKPVEEKPVEEKPVEEKPIEEKPVEEKPAVQVETEQPLRKSQENKQPFEETAVNEQVKVEEIVEIDHSSKTAAITATGQQHQQQHQQPHQSIQEQILESSTSDTSKIATAPTSAAQKDEKQRQLDKKKKILLAKEAKRTIKAKAAEDSRLEREAARLAKKAEAAAKTAEEARAKVIAAEEARANVIATEMETARRIETEEERARILAAAAAEDARSANNARVNPQRMATTRKQPSISATTTNYESSGWWKTIDKYSSLGFASLYPQSETFRISHHLRPIRKAASRATGLTGLISGKIKQGGRIEKKQEKELEPLNEQQLTMIQRRIAVIESARARVAHKIASESDRVRTRTRRGDNDEEEPKGIARLFRRNNGGNNRKQAIQLSSAMQVEQDAIQTARELEILRERQRVLDAIAQAEAKAAAEERAIAEEEDRKRMKRVKEIDALIHKSSEDLIELQCEKDYLQRRPNPLFNYTFSSSEGKGEGDKEKKKTAAMNNAREFNFPPESLVDEYMDQLVSNKRLVMLNHTYLWRERNGNDEDDDETIGDDLLTPSADARKLYENNGERRKRSPSTTRGSKGERNNGSGGGGGNGGGGSWLLRQGSIGEKIGEGIEMQAYKAVCNAVMSILARSIAAIHGVNIMSHSDIRLFMEDGVADFPPVGELPGTTTTNGGKGDSYAHEAIQKAIRRGAKRNNHHNHHHNPTNKKNTRSSHHEDDDATFLQRDAVVETLISHCQISAPLLKLFPLAWQRAILGNIVTLIAALVSDFAAGIRFQILGHQLSFSFRPITERDLIYQYSQGMSGPGGYPRFNHRQSRPEEFEAAVRATAADMSASLTFLDRWHERVLGGGVLKAQIGNLIARIVLTLVDEVLSGAQMNLWTKEAGGPRVVAGLEYRTKPNHENLDVW